MEILLKTSLNDCLSDLQRILASCPLNSTNLQSGNNLLDDWVSVHFIFARSNEFKSIGLLSVKPYLFYKQIGQRQEESISYCKLQKASALGEEKEDSRGNKVDPSREDEARESS